MGPLIGSSKKIDAALSGTKIPLDIVKELADLIPADCVGPILGVTLKIIEMIEGARTNKETCLELQEDLKSLMVVVLTPLQGKTDHELRGDPSLKRNLDRLAVTLSNAHDTVQELEKNVRSVIKGLVFYKWSADKLKACRQSLAWAMQEFQVATTIQSRLEDARRHVQSTKEHGEILQAVNDIPARVQEMVSTSANFILAPLSTYQLPAAPEVFHGRDESVQQAVDLLIENDRARVLLCGSGGIGKTSLALTVVHHPDVVNRFGKTHRYWVPCEEATTPAAFVQIVAGSLGITIPSGSKDPFRDLVTILETSQVVPRLLILDNFETTWNTDQQPIVRKILGNLAALKGISILMTTRDADRATFQIAWSQPRRGPPLETLGPLTLEAARAVYLERVPQAQPDDDLDQLLLAIDCYPLAITLMASQGALGETPLDLLNRWKEERSKLLSDGFDKETNLEISMALSINSPSVQKDTEVLQVLGMLALLPAGTTTQLLPPMSNLSGHINTLVKVSLAFRRTTASGSIIHTHSPISSYALKNHPPHSHTLDLLFLTYVQLVECYTTAVPGSEEQKNSMEVLSGVEPNIDSVLRYSLIHGDHQKTFNSIVRYTVYLYHIRPNVDLLRYALNRSRSDLVTASDRAEALYQLGESQRMLDNHVEARNALEEASQSFDRLGDEGRAAQCQNSLGNILYSESQYLEAREKLEAAESTFKAIGNQLGAAQCQRSLGEIFQAQGLYADAEQLFRKALSASQAIGDKLNAAYCLYELGTVAHDCDRAAEAQEHMEGALALFKAIGDQRWIGYSERRLDEWST